VNPLFEERDDFGFSIAEKPSIQNGDRYLPYTLLGDKEFQAFWEGVADVAIA